jgi:hypothetical protein
MRWGLDVGTYVHSLPDLGVPPERWAVLWDAITTEVGRRGGRLLVDGVGLTFFGR